MGGLTHQRIVDFPLEVRYRTILNADNVIFLTLRFRLFLLLPLLHFNYVVLMQR